MINNIMKVNNQLEGCAMCLSRGKHNILICVAFTYPKIADLPLVCS